MVSLFGVRPLSHAALFCLHRLTRKKITWFIVGAAMTLVIQFVVQQKYMSVMCKDLCNQLWWVLVLLTFVMHNGVDGKGVDTMNTQQAMHRALTLENEDTDFVDNEAWLTAVREGYLKDPQYIDLATITKVECGNFAPIPLVSCDIR